MELSELSNIVKKKVFLPDIAEQVTHLRQSGNEYHGLCPFHDDHHPSLSIYEKNGIWHFYCHSCGASGDVIDWVKKQYHKNFTQSVYMLAKYSHINTTDIADDVNEWSDEIPPLSKVSEPSAIDKKIIEDLESRRKSSNFYVFLRTLFDEETVNQAFTLYHIGATRNYRTVFPQIDRKGVARQGKGILYLGNGHRDKQTIPQVWSLGKYLNLPNMVQCLFGEHLLSVYPDKPLVLVEAEKTAVIAYCLIPQFNWLATGSKQNFKATMLAPLSDRHVTVFPDVDAFSEWTVKSRNFTFANIEVSSLLQESATTEQKKSKIDIADILIEQLQKPIKATQEAQTVLDEQLPITKKTEQSDASERQIEPTEEKPYYHRFKTYPRYELLENVIANDKYNTLIDYRDPAQVYAKLDWKYNRPAWTQEEWISHYKRMVPTDIVIQSDVDFYKVIDLFEYADKDKGLIRFVG